MEEVYKLIIGICVLALGIPIGNLLARATKEELKDMLFAWKVNKHVKSNSIVFAKDDVPDFNMHNWSSFWIGLQE